MKIVIGTTNKRKISVLEKVLNQLLPHEVIEVVSYNADSQVSTTPWDTETLAGAQNRAQDCKKHILDGEYFVGLESGLVERYGSVYEEAWCVVLTQDGKEYMSYSSGLRVPDHILTRMKTDEKMHWEVINILNKEQGISDQSDTWGTYTGKSLVRDISFEEAIRNAFIQIIKSDTSLF